MNEWGFCTRDAKTPLDPKTGILRVRVRVFSSIYTNPPSQVYSNLLFYFIMSLKSRPYLALHALNYPYLKIWNRIGIFDVKTVLFSWFLNTLERTPTSIMIQNMPHPISAIIRSSIWSFCLGSRVFARTYTVSSSRKRPNKISFKKDARCAEIFSIRIFLLKLLLNPYTFGINLVSKNKKKQNSSPHLTS